MIRGYKSLDDTYKNEKAEYGFIFYAFIYLLIAITSGFISLIVLTTSLDCQVYCCRAEDAKMCVNDIAYYSDTLCFQTCNYTINAQTCDTFKACEQDNFHLLASISIAGNLLYIILLFLYMYCIKFENENETIVCVAWWAFRLVRFTCCVLMCIFIVSYYYDTVNDTLDYVPFSSISDGKDKCVDCFGQTKLFLAFLIINVGEACLSLLEYFLLCIFGCCVGMRGISVVFGC